MKRNLIQKILVILTLATSVLDSAALPSFSRKYGTSCVTCHEAFPRRNIIGEAFRLNGYHFADDEAYVKVAPVEMGDEAYNRLWPNALWSSDIPASFPFSAVMKFLMEADLDGSRSSDLLFLFPEEIELVWAGTIGKSISFYGDIILLQKDLETSDDIESWAQLKARVSFHDIVGPENLLNLNIGSVGMQTLGLYPALAENNLSTHYYQYTSWTMPNVSLNQSGLSDFQGNPFSLGPQVGVELYGFGSRWKYAAAVVSGDVINGSAEVPDGDVIFMGTGRTRSEKDAYASFSYKFGGLGFDGSGTESGDPTKIGPQYWRDNSLIVSLLGYIGSAQVLTETQDGLVSTEDDDFWRVGIGLQQKYNDLTVAAGYMYGDNDRPYGSLSPESVESHALFAEASYYVFPWLIPYLRYEALFLDLPENVPGLDPDHDTQRVMVGAKALLRANVALTLETTFFTQGEKVQEGFDRTLMLLLSASF